LVPSLVGLVCMFILIFVPGAGNRFTDLGAGGLFFAVFSAVVSHLLFFFFYRYRLVVVRPKASTSYLAQVVLLLEPALFTILIFGIVRYIFNSSHIYNIPAFLHEHIVNMLSGVYQRFSSLTGIVIFFTMMHQLLWFFGFHGGEIVSDVVVNVGGSDVLCADFFQYFVFVGGSGALALIIAVVIVRWKNAMRPALFSLPMGIANVGSPILFGLPVLFNPFFIIPFIISPILMGFIS